MKKKERKEESGSEEATRERHEREREIEGVIDVGKGSSMLNHHMSYCLFLRNPLTQSYLNNFL